MSDEIISYDGRSLPQAWLRMERESSKAYSAFQLFLGLGEGRTLTKCAEHLHITRQSVSAMAKRWHWDQRTRAYDNWKALEIHERVAQRLAQQADQYSRLASEQLERMDHLDGLQECALATKVAADLCRMQSNNGEIVDGLAPSLPSPVFLISQIPERPKGYCFVRWGEGKGDWTWIKLEDAPEYARAHPDHMVIA
jgi:hypothetical protein